MGTADYYGVTANTAARIMAKALPGQVLIDGHLPFSSRSREVHDEVHAMGVELQSASFSQKVGAVVLYPLGRHLLKGIRNPIPIFEVLLTDLKAEAHLTIPPLRTWCLCNWASGM